MAYARSTLEKFIKRELDEWDFLKSLPEEKLDQQLKAFWPTARFKLKPYKHQKVAILLGISNPGFMYLMDMGTGKSGVSLIVHQYNVEFNGAKKLLIVVPNEVAVETWKKEIKLFTNFKSIALIGTRAEREALLRKKADIYLINYAGLQVFMTEIVKAKKGGRGKRTPIPQKIDKFIANFDSVIFDEIHACKNHESTTFELSDYLASACRFRYGLTGTPFGRDPLNLWSQFFLTDRGETLGNRIELFRDSFFNKEVGYFGASYVLDKRKEKRLFETLKHRSIRYEAGECNDLPDLVKVPVPLTMHPDALGWYHKMLDEFMAHEESEAGAKATSFIKMRQIMSGFLYMENKETGEKHQMEFSHNPKLEYLENLIDQIDSEEKVVIFHEFTKSCELICRLLDSKKIKYETLNGQTKDPAKALTNFQNKKNVKCFIVNSKSGSSNLNLQVARYMVFYESPVSPIIRAQAEKRCHRTGQTRKVFIYDLFIRKSVEERVHEFLREGKDLSEALLKGKKDQMVRSFFIE